MVAKKQEGGIKWKRSGVSQSDLDEGASLRDAQQTSVQAVPDKDSPYYRQHLDFSNSVIMLKNYENRQP